MAGRERKIAEAEEAAKLLEKAGAKQQADAVRRLIRSHISLIETASRLWHDNAALRAQPPLVVGG